MDYKPTQKTAGPKDPSAKPNKQAIDGSIVAIPDQGPSSPGNDKPSPKPPVPPVPGAPQVPGGTGGEKPSVPEKPPIPEKPPVPATPAKPSLPEGGIKPPLPAGGIKPSPSKPGSSATPNADNLDKWDWSLGQPLSKETDKTFGGTKPGKAPTIKPPEPPDPFKLIEFDAKTNRINTNGPLGSNMFSIDPETGQWSQKQTFSPELGALYKNRLGLVNEDLKLPDIPTDFSDQSNRAIQSTYQAASNLLDPRFKRESDDLTSRLANQGIMEGSEAYKNAWNEFNQRKDETYNQLGLQAVTKGQEEQNRLFGQGLQSAQTRYQQSLGRRSQLYNELASLIGTQQIKAPSAIDTEGPFSQQYAGQLNAVNAANQAGAQRNSQTTNAAATLGTLLLSMLL